MLNRAIAAELARLTAIVQSDDAIASAAAREAIEGFLQDHGMTWESWTDWMNETADTHIERLQHLPHISAPPHIRPGGLWRPVFQGDGTTGFATCFANGVIARVGQD